MFSVPQTLISKLKCSQCQEIISCPPVYTKKNLENICGRCTPSKTQKKTIVRNKLFEDLAELFLFPCKYAEQGCDIKFKWGETLEHETNCPSIMENAITCPTLPVGSCKWKGLSTRLMEHFKAEHKESVVKHPYNTNYHDNWIITDLKQLVKTSSRIFIMSAHGFIFLIRFKVCFQSDSIYITVTLLGEASQNLAVHFECNVELLYKDVAKNFIYVSQVLPNTTTFDENCVVKTELHKNITISITRNNVKCTNCNKIFTRILHDEQKFCCDEINFVRCEKTETKRTVQRCYFHEYGCDYTDIPSNVSKHVILLCKYACVAPCYICKFKNQNAGISMFDHIKTHCQTTFSKTFDIILREDLCETTQVVWETDRGTFFCTWGTYIEETIFGLFPCVFRETEIIFFCRMVNNLPEKENEKLVINLTFVDKHTAQTIREKFIKRNINDLRKSSKNEFVCDWELKFNLPPQLLFLGLYYSLNIDIE